MEEQNKSISLQDYLKKPAWLRFEDALPEINNTLPVSGTKSISMSLSQVKRQLISQDTILKELFSGCHIINNTQYRSFRKKYRYDEKTKKNVLDGYEDVTRVAVSWQEVIAGKKTSHCFGNAPVIVNEGETSDAPQIDKIKARMNEMNISACLSMLADSIFRTGDGAVYLYIEDEQIKYKVFTYEPGKDGGSGSNCTLTNDYEDPSKKMGVRMFAIEDRVAVELYREKVIELYIKPTGDDDVIKKLYPTAPGTKTEDGYVLMDKTETAIKQGQFVYFRNDDVPWGPAQKNIEYWEKLLSDCGENVKYYAYQMLFLSGKPMSLPNANFGGRVLASSDPNGDAKMLEPADASNTLTIALKKTIDAISDESSSVFIRPDELKGQNDSGAYLANLYFPEVQYAIRFYGKFDNAFKKILKIITLLTGVLEEKPSDYSKIRLSYKIEPFIPKNNYEDAQIINDSVGAGTLSVATASESHPMAHSKEGERLSKEVVEEETETPVSDSGNGDSKENKDD